MIKVSDEFKKAVYAPIRTTIGRVTFEILDNEAYGDATVTASSEASISRKVQLTNKRREASNKYATFEPDYFKLDGSFCIPPKNTDATEDEIGWCSSILSDDNSLFTPNQTLEFKFTKSHSNMGVTIIFDTLNNEYATDFDIAVYNLTGSIIYSNNIVGNDEAKYILMQPLENYGRIVVTIKKWCKPFRRARVTEVDFGIIKEYEDSKLIKMNIIEEISVTSETTPANEIKLTVDNSDRAFNILNPEGLYKFLRERQEVTASLGIVKENGDIEYIPMGKYYLCDWQSGQGSLTATFTARDILDILTQYDYENLTVSNTNLYDVAENALNVAGMKDYSIDEKLKNISTQGYIKKCTCREALQCVAIASRAAVYSDRYGKLIIKQFETLSESSSYLYFAGPDTYTGTIYPAIDGDFDIKGISLDNMYSPAQINLDKPIKSVEVVVYDNQAETSTMVVITDDAVKSGGNLKVENTLINSLSVAQAVGNWLLNESKLRALYSVDWRQNPALECGDIVIIEDTYGEKKQSRIIKQEFNYEGYLSGKTESKGGV